MTRGSSPAPRRLAPPAGTLSVLCPLFDIFRDMPNAPRGRRARRRAAVAAALLSLGALGAACSPRGPSAVPYRERVEALRTAKEQFLSTGADSPIPAARQRELLPLAYFPIDESYVVAASLVPSELEPAMEMPTSTGQRRQMRRAGTLKFALKGRPCQLTAFVEAGSPDVNRLFVPFGDMTNGTETYAPGRYLDLDRSATGLYEVDFNRAYHPYCYYNETYDCPYPPAENRLSLPVRAGERIRKSS